MTKNISNKIIKTADQTISSETKTTKLDIAMELIAMLKDELDGSETYKELAQMLLEAGVAKEATRQILEIASDEERHYGIVKNILNQITL